MIAEEQDRPIIVSKVKYLGSSLLPSPIELETTIVLYHNRMHIPELDATITIDKVSQIELAKRIGINSTAIVQVERGHRKCWPKLRKQLARILEVDEANLFNEEGWPKKVKVDVRGE